MKNLKREEAYQALEELRSMAISHQRLRDSDERLVAKHPVLEAMLIVDGTRYQTAAMLLTLVYNNLTEEEAERISQVVFQGKTTKEDIMGLKSSTAADWEETLRTIYGPLEVLQNTFAPFVKRQLEIYGAMFSKKGWELREWEPPAWLQQMETR